MLDHLPLLKTLKHDQWVKPFLKHYKRTLVLAISLGILTFVCAGGLMFTSGFLISKSATRPDNILLVYVPIVLTRGFGIFRPVFRYAERLTSHNWVFKMTSEFRKKMYDSLEQDAVFFNSKYRLGDLLGLLSEDVAHIQNLYLRTIFPNFVAWGVYTIIIVGLGCISPLMGLTTLILFGLMIFAIPAWSVVINGARQEYEKQVKNDLYADLTDNVMGIVDWVFAQRNQEYVDEHLTSENKLFATQEALHRFERFRDFLMQVVILAIVLSLMIWGAAKLGGQYGGPANWIAAFVLAVFPLEDALASLPAAAQETNVYVDSLKRLNQLPPVSEGKAEQLSVQKPLDLKIQNLHYTYPGTDKEVLRGLNLSIPTGQKVAILGKSGSGKSTLASLIRGDRQPSLGDITLARIPTHDYGDQIAKYIGVINQSPYLFNTTILNNLRIGNENATIDDVWQILDQVGLRQMIESLPQGLETMVDSAGLRFSGGERHRLALARILLANTPIVLLDEPTVGLDPVTEREVMDTFFSNLQGKTLIWITHHLQGIDAMDRVLFIEDGELAMDGHPAELAKTNERYQRLKAVDEGR
ncbi:MAG TPA: thiol reductant ABC exporter subunit CydC [Candidatus Limosilactobacillus faecipullorum]|nr:thiol reductant ABC exporter subunit CydC [Candidatus Limosilactobacillus faecipullorum]